MTAADSALLVDRFVSASSATDAHDSLQALLTALKRRELDSSVLLQEQDLLRAFLDVLATSKHNQVPLEEGPSLVCRIYLCLLLDTEASTVLLKQPAPLAWMQSLLDVISDEIAPNYTRVLCLQLLEKVAQHAPSLTQSQLLEIPNGLVRLADLLQSDDVNEQVRNQVLGGIAQTIVQWPSCRKIWVFSEACDVLCGIIQKEGGLTGGNVLVRDCLNLLQNLVMDASLSDLIWGSPVVVPTLAGLLDLRGGADFVRPPKPVIPKTDDLDAILKQGEKQESSQVIPRLTLHEEQVISDVLHILGTLMEVTSKAKIWKQHAPLCSLVWELALVSPSPSKPVCALPSAKLQQEALETVSLHFNEYEKMQSHYGMDRLLYFCCTGGQYDKYNEKLGISQAALHVLRTSLPFEQATDVLTHTLAPPMDQQEEDAPSTTTVQRLFNTVFENLALPSESERNSAVMERRRINVLGALGALGVFLDSSTNREVMLAIASLSNFITVLLQTLAKEEDDIVRLALLRFACEWVDETPTVVQALLQSTESPVLSVLLVESEISGSLSAMTGFLFGLCMTSMPPVGDEGQYGGWTRSSILQLLGKMRGISGYQTTLEDVKKKMKELPWSACALEMDRFSKWYASHVLSIRKCIVQELTRGGGDDEGEAGGGDETKASNKSLERIVAQQAQELEELRSSLDDAKDIIESQEGQLAVWKRRVESTPTQLDEMLTEYTGKNAEMEKSIASLRKELQESCDSHQSQLRERNDEILKLQRTVQEWEAQQRELQEERDRLGGELEGLTSAYTTLEQEYNRRAESQRIAAAAAAPAGETSDDRPGQQPEGEVSHQEHTSAASSGELATLRSENARLRSDAQAADDWMAMAVQRMNDIGGQNQTLQQEVETLRQQLEQAQLTGVVSTGITQQQLEQEQHHRSEIEERLKDADAERTRLLEQVAILRKQLEESSRETADITALKDFQERLQEEKTRRQQLEAELLNSQKDTATAMDALGDAKSDKERLERSMASMESELESARTEIASLLDEGSRMENEIESLRNSASAAAATEEAMDTKEGELEELRKLVASKDEELEVLRKDLSQVRQSNDADVETKTQELFSLHEKLRSLTHDLEATREELKESTSRERKEIQKRNTRIHQLESQLSQKQQQPQPTATGDAAGYFGGAAATPDNRDEEIEGLRAANDAAQEWMAKAVEHHRILSEQVAALTEDKAALTQQINELQLAQSALKPSESLGTSETIHQLQRELWARTEEATELGAKVIKLESALRIHETEVAADVQGKTAKFGELQEQMQSVEEFKGVSIEQQKVLEDQISKLSGEKDETVWQAAALRHELDEKNVTISLTPPDEVQSLTQLLAERDAEIELIRGEVERAKDGMLDAEQLRAALDNARDEASRLKTDLDGALSSLHQKSASFDELQADVQRMYDEASRLASVHEAKEADVKRLQSENESLELERTSLIAELDSMKELAADMQGKLDEFESWAGAAQQKITELQSEKEGLEQKLASFSESDTAEEFNRLKASTMELDTKLEKMLLDHDNLHAKNRSLEQDLKVLEGQRDQLVERSKQAEVLAKEKEGKLRAVEDNVAELEQGLKVIQDESAGVVDEWKGRVEELESNVTDLEEVLQRQQQEASEAVDQWSARCLELEALNSELELEVERSSKERDELTATLENERESSRKDTAARIEVEKSEWIAEKERMLTQIAELNATAMDSSKAVETTKEELTLTKALVTEKEKLFEAHLSKLNATIQELEQDLASRADEANEAISKWESHCTTLEETSQNLEEELQAVIEERDKLSLLSLSLEESMEPLQNQLDEEIASKSRVVEENEQLIHQIKEVKIQSEEIVNQWKESTTELESMVRELEEQLEMQQEEATLAISQWESRCSDLTEKIASLEEDLEESTSSLIAYLRSEVEKHESLIAKAGVELDSSIRIRSNAEVALDESSAALVVASLKTDLEHMNTVLVNAVVSMLLERASLPNVQSWDEAFHQKIYEVQDLEAQIKELESQLADKILLQGQIHELQNALQDERETLKLTGASLEKQRELTETLEMELRVLREEVEKDAFETHLALSKEQAACEVAERSLAALQESVAETEKALVGLRSQEEQIIQGSQQSAQDFKKTHLLLQEKEEQLMIEREKFEEERALIVHERDDLKAMVGELQEDLRDATDALQACITDEISERATEVATFALRQQMERMRLQIQNDQEAYFRERKLHSAAEKEVESLKADLANVLGIAEGRDDASSQVQRMTMEASKELQRREREEIAELRKCLERALQDLASAQAAERKASESAASSRLQLSVCEQEVMAAKSDLAFLTQTLEEIQEVEASRAASLEYRINSLEDDREVLRRFHADELENLRNELTHVSMEKDRILHALKESEKKNAALVFSTSPSKRASEESTAPDTELARLRIEKAQLLAAAAEEGSRTERRIREAVAAQVSSAEADVILERELRVAAEAAVEDFRLQIDELKTSKATDDDEARSTSRAMDRTDAGSISALDQLSAELKQFKDENRSLTAEIKSLRNELEKAKEESTIELEIVTEKWRKAQARARRLESTGSFDVEVNKEVSRLRAAHGADVGEPETNWIVVSSNPAVDEGEPGLSAIDAYDLIQEQQIAIQEERAMYLDLLAEHDDLLSLLVQQDLEKSSLHDALARIGGPDAVDAAIASAEETAVRQFGKYVKVGRDL